MGRYARQDRFNASRRGCRNAAANGGGGGPSDPLIAQVVALLPLDGADQAVTASDMSPSGHPLTFGGQAKLVTADKKFGLSSAYFDGLGDYIEIANHADFDFGTGDFTLEAWVKFETGSTGSDRCIFSKWDSVSGTYRGFLLFMDATDGRLEYFCSPNGSTTRVFNGDANAAVTENVWQHIAIAKESGTTRGFLDGTLCLEATWNEAVFGGTSDVQIGKIQDTSGTDMPFKGWIDDVRFTNGTARYTENFTVPAEAHPTS